MAKKAFHGVDINKMIDVIKPDQNEVISINIPSDLKESQVDFDEILDSVYYVKLEKANDALIGNIDKILFFENKILVVERVNRQSALIFSNEGKFINTLGKPGKGPSEYLSIRDVAIDNNNKRIILVDGSAKKLRYYDFMGNYLGDDRLFFYSTDLSILEDGSMIFYQMRDINLHIPSVTDYQLLFTEASQKITGKSLSYYYRDMFPKNEINSLHSFNVSKNSVLFTPVFKDTIFEITGNNKIKAKYSIKMGDDNVVNKMNPSTTTEDYIRLLNQGDVINFDGCAIETDNFLYLKILFGDCYFSKKTWKPNYGYSYICKSSCEKVLKFEQPLTSNDHFFVSVIYPYKVLPQLELMNRKFDINVNRIIKTLKIDDNPILMFYSLK